MENSENISRRDFIKKAGLGLLAASAIAQSCSDDSKQVSAAVNIPKGKMTLRENPNTKDKVSLLGYGMMRLPVISQSNDKIQGSARESNAPIDQETVNKMVDYAIEHGVNYFDTSPAYCKGKSEHSTGIALSRHDRKKYFIATKLSNYNPATWSRKASMEMFENSLKELQVDYIDYLLLHGVGMGEDALHDFNGRYIDNGILDWLVEQKQKGRIRNLGFSYHGDIRIFDMLLKWHDEGKYHWDFVQIQMNYVDWKYAKLILERNTNAEYLYSELEKRGIPAVVMEPLLGGRLVKMPDKIVEQMKRREPERSVASWSFRFLGTYPNVMTSLSGMTYMENLEDNLITHCPMKTLNDEEMRFLADVAKQIVEMKTVPCNECQYCMPCPYGLDIPSIFSHYNKCITEGNLAETSADSDYKKQRRAFLIGYDRSVSKLRQANMCTSCRECVSHCPQRIDIPAELQKIDRHVEHLKRHA
ncbi:MAG: aldo/keto reductase [Bacteroidales bacterium]|nr:aldo/keto reductase [Bacteroidales bacterium]